MSHSAPTLPVWDISGKSLSSVFRQRREDRWIDNPPSAPDACGTISQKSRLLLYGKPIPDGMKLGWTCAVRYCGNPNHFVLAENLTGDWRDYKEIRAALCDLRDGESFDLPDEPADEKSVRQLHAGLGITARTPHFLLRSLPTGGIRIIRTGTWGGDRKEFYALHPQLVRVWAKPLNSIGSVFLGLLWGTWDVPIEERPERVPLCSEKACAFPRMNGATVCRSHWQWDSAIVSYPREHRLNYQAEAFARKSDDRSVGSGGLDAAFHSGWLAEDKYNFLNVRTLTTKAGFVTRSKAERDNDKWWKENVVDQGIEAPGVVVRKTSKELKAEMEAMIETSLQQYNIEQSEAAMRAFWKVRKEPNPLRADPFNQVTPRLKIGDGAATSLHGKMRRGGGHGQGIRKKQRKRAAGWTSSRHNHDPQYFTRETVRGMEFDDMEAIDIPEDASWEEA